MAITKGETLGLQGVRFSTLVEKVVGGSALCESLGAVDGLEVVVFRRLGGGGFGGCGIGGDEVDKGTRKVAGEGIGSER